MEAHLTDIDYEQAAQYEQKLRHDVMAHVHTFGDGAAPRLCPSSTWAPPAAMWEITPMSSLCGKALYLVRDKLVRVLAALGQVC